MCEKTPLRKGWRFYVKNNPSIDRRVKKSNYLDCVGTFGGFGPMYSYR